MITLLFEFYRGDFEIMVGHDRTANVRTFRQLYSACEQMVVFRFDKKHKRYLYCRILWGKLLICLWYSFLVTDYDKSCYL